MWSNHVGSGAYEHFRWETGLVPSDVPNRSSVQKFSFVRGLVGDCVTPRVELVMARPSAVFGSLWVLGPLRTVQTAQH